MIAQASMKTEGTFVEAMVDTAYTAYMYIVD